MGSDGDISPEAKELIKWVASRLSNGERAEKIASDLVEGGTSKEDARSFVHAVQKSLRAEQATRTDTDFLRGWGIAILVFIALNMVLYFGQEWLNRDRIAQAEALEQQLTRMDARIESIKSEYDAGVASSRDVFVHDSLVDVYNRKVKAYNDIAEKAYSKLLLIPVPGRGGRRATH